MQLDINQIRLCVGEDNFNKGKNFSKSNIELDSHEKVDSTEYLSYTVQSETHYYTVYFVDIKLSNNEIISTDCDCPQFSSWGACKHVAACLLKYREENISPEEKKLLISKKILKEFYKPIKEDEIHLKKELELEITLSFHDNYYSRTEVKVDFRIGENKLYSFNSKLNQFLSIYEDGETCLNFGKNFIYDPKRHYFNKQDEDIIKYLLKLYHKNMYYNFNYLTFNINDFASFLEVIENKKFLINNYGVINQVLRENPINLSLEKGEKYYKLSFLEQDVDILSNNCKYIIKDNILYELPPKASQILSLMQSNRLHDIEFEESDLEIFKNGILPIVKNNVVLDDTVKDNFVLNIKPIPKIYFDFKENVIICNLKFSYNEEEIDYFETSEKIIRDKELEALTLQDILSLGFVTSQNKIYLEDLELIGEFLDTHLIELAKRYEVFTSDKMKNTKILKNNKVSSSFSIGTDNIMKYEFDLGNISEDEIVSVLESIKNKKKYYRLKSGDLLNLEENNDLKELEELTKDLNLSNKDIKNGKGIIPKYRAIYLDSIKKDKYHIINTNNSFDNLINKFNSYKNEEIILNTKDKKILRDYQEIGVKWLKNIYKCGFGGILADEMGLGKSIQLIYLIKQILKEKSDSKILIVAPTSLIYNWYNEFVKFGSEIKFKVFAENREKRKEELENINDINVLITTYGLIRQDKEIYTKINFSLIAIDEAQNIKNSNAQMTKIIKELKSDCKLALTGTPLENSVMELWSIFDFVMPGYLSNYTDFGKKYNIKDVTEEDLKIFKDLDKQIKPFILRRKKKDVVKELPPKLENNIYIDLNKEQKKLYVVELEKTRKELDEIIATEGFQKGSFKILQLLTKLRQICIEPSIVFENYNSGSSKIDNLVEITKGIIENGHKILLFTSFKTALDIVNKEFNNHNISTYIIDGSVSSKKRMELVDKFNNDNTNVFLITLKAGGTGLNLTSADVVIHLDLWWNPQVENQATDRAHRIGQKNTVEVIKLICKGTIEERILELQNKKKILSEVLIEGEDRDKNIFSKLTEKDIKNLLSLDNED